MAVFFNGRLLVTPAVATAVYDMGMLDRNPATGNTLAMIGESTGGIPFEPTYLYSVPDARDYLKGGSLLRACELAFAPSPETAGPQVICVVRVSSATQSSLTLSNTASASVISLVSTDYGDVTNNIRIKVEAGTLKSSDGFKNISISDETQLLTGEDIGRLGMTVIPSLGTAWSCTVNDAGMSVTSGGAGSVTVAFSTYQTVDDVVAKINASTYIDAVTIPGSGSLASSATFDAMTAKVMSSATATTVTQHISAITEWINQVGAVLTSATRTANAAINVNTSSWTYMAGASDGASVTDAEYGVALTALEAEDVQWIVPVTSNSAVHSRVSTHCTNVSTAQKRERRAFVGGPTGLTKSQAVTAAAAINNDRVAYVYPGIYHYDTTGMFYTRGLILYDPFYTAALMGGAFAGLTPGETMTNKSVLVHGLESNLVAPNDTDTLIRGGVCTLYKDHRGAIRVARAISTWLNDTRYNRVEVSTGAVVDYVARSVRDALQPFVGNKASPITLQRVNSTVESILYRLAAAEPVGLGMLVGDDEQPAYKNITSSIDGDVLRVSFECSPAIPINYILISLHITPYRTSY